MYRKIDIYVNGEYVCSTTQRASLKEAKQKFIENPRYMGKDGMTTVTNIHRVTVKYSK